MHALSETFDRVVVVNLARRPERMACFRQTLPDDWPFRPPRRFEAIDGAAAKVPAGWRRGAGAWGCMQSHRRIIRSAIAEGVDSVFILEDDAVPVPRFSQLAGHFLSRVPADWDCLMLGGEHLLPPIAVSAGVVRCVSTSRTHAFAIRRAMMPGLLKFWETVVSDHCDIVLAACMTHFKAYAPDPFLIGQDEGYSDIMLRREQLRFLSPADQETLARPLAI